MQKIELKKDINIIKKETKSYFLFLKNIFLFILFSFFNAFIPLIISLVLSQVKNNGLQYASAIGYLTSIQLGFIQLSWTITITLIYVFYKENILHKISSNEDKKILLSSALVIVFIYSFIITPIYVGSSYGYNLYASNHINTLIGQEQGNLYIYSFSPYIFLSGILYLFVIYIYLYKSKITAIFVYLGFQISSIIFLCAGIFINNSLNIQEYNYGLAAGLSLSLNIIIYLLALCLIYLKDIKIYISFNNLSLLLLYAKHSFRPLITILSIQIFKAFALLALGLIIPDTMNQLVPLNYQIARVVWYNLLYLMPFMGMGLSDGILFSGLLENKNYKQLNNIVCKSIIFFIVWQIIYLPILYFSIDPIVGAYVSNNVINTSNYGDIKIDYTIDAILKKPEYIDKLNILINNPDKVTALLVEKFKIPQKVAESVTNNLIAVLKLLANESTRPEGIIKLNQLFNTLESIKPGSINIVKQYLYELSSNVSKVGVLSMVRFPTSNVFAYFLVWTTLYPIGLIMNSATIIMRKKWVNWVQLVLILLVQAWLISSIVSFGVIEQYNPMFELYDAWTLPFVLFIPFIFLYYLIMYIIFYKNNKKNDQNNIVLLN